MIWLSDYFSSNSLEFVEIASVSLLSSIKSQSSNPEMRVVQNKHIAWDCPKPRVPKRLASNSSASTEFGPFYPGKYYATESCLVAPCELSASFLQRSRPSSKDSLDQ